MKRDSEEKDIGRIFAEGTLIDEALARAVREALIRHRLLGNPVAEWRDGRVVWVQPEDIPVDEQPRNPSGES
jgi:hypothetical protein